MAHQNTELISFAFNELSGSVYTIGVSNSIRNGIELLEWSNVL